MEHDMESMWQAMKGSHFERTIEKLTSVIKKTTSLDEALGMGISVVVDALHAQYGTLWVYYQYEDGRIHPRVTYGGSELPDVSLPFGEGIVGQVIEQGRALIIMDCQATPVEDKDWKDVPDESKSMICVPLSIDGAPFACLQVINRTDNMLFDKQDLRFAERVANEVMMLLEEHQLLGRVHPPKNDSPDFASLFCQDDEKEMLKLLRAMPAFDELTPRQQRKVEKYCRKIQITFCS